MNSRAPLRFRLSAFTLVELLTVIAIIAILMGLLFPALQIVKNQANKVRAKTDVVNTVAAVKQYYAEYGKYPLTGAINLGNAQTNADVLFGDSNSVPNGSPNANNLLFDILRNYPNLGGSPRPSPDGNPRQITFFEGRNGTPTNATPLSGFMGSSTGGTGGVIGCFYDPWGNQYAISIDGTYDNWVPVPYLDFTVTNAGPTTPSPGVNVGCAAWSVGKDGKLGTSVSGSGDSYYKNPSLSTTSDDVISWQ